MRRQVFSETVDRAHPLRAFTLVELLAVIAIVGVLVSLLLPAVQLAREAARRSQCANNLKQIGLALQMHHDAQQALPPGWIAYNPDTGDLDPEGVKGWGWAARILPYLEQGNLSEGRVHLESPIEDPENEAARLTVLAVYRCPTDSPESEIWDLQEENGEDGENEPEEDESGEVLLRLAFGSYVGVFGTEDIEDDPGRGEGPLFHNSNVEFRHITDGLSNSLLVGERSSGLGFSTWVGVVPGGEESMDRILGVCNVPPNSLQQEEAGEIDGFSSFHATGTIFLQADGSVHWVDENVNLGVYQALATISGEEPLDRP